MHSPKYDGIKRVKSYDGDVRVPKMFPPGKDGNENDYVYWNREFILGPGRG